jgi:protocatechuate 3,4-dioxygenase beta subunit
MGTATVGGSVTIAGSGQPARGTTVTLSANDIGVSRSSETDAQGRFSFAALPAGRYNLQANKPGHVSAAYGQTRPGRPGTPIQLADGQRFDARLQIYKGGVLTGTVLDEHAEAAPNTQVRVLRYMTQGGHRTLQSTASGSTDDRGIYRVFNLQPGDYVVCATPPRNAASQTDVRLREIDGLRQRVAALARTDEAAARELAARADSLQAEMADEEQQTGYAPVYYPGTTSSSEAGTIRLGVGEEKPGLDFQFQRVPVARVEGLVVNPTGQPLQNIQLSLVNAAGSLPGVDTNGARADAEGRFRLSNVAPGQYTLIAQARQNPPPGPPPPNPAQPRATAPRAEPLRFWAMTTVSVDGRNLSNVVLTLQPGMTVAGRVLFQGTTQPPADFSRVRVSLSPMDVSSGVARAFASSAAGRVEANGRFTITGVLPGKYRLNASGGGTGWFLEASTIDGQNTLDFPAEVKPGQSVTGAVVSFTDRQAELSGTITNERGQPAPDYTVVVYPADARYWVSNSMRIRTTRPATDGRFVFTGLPPGEYRLAPILDAEPGSWYDPAFLQQLDAGAVGVQIGDGEKKVQTLHVGGVRL